MYVHGGLKSELPGEVVEAAGKVVTGVMEMEREEEEDIVKGSIASHPMFGLLKETHMNCLKVCLGEEEEIDESLDRDQRPTNTMEMSSELDLFMEAYYMALLELQRAIQEPMQEASAFIEFMHQLLEEEDGGRPYEQRELLCSGGGPAETVGEETGRLAFEKLSE